MNLRCGCAVLAALVCGVAATVARAQKELLAETLGFSFEMPRDAVTSAGVYDPAGHLIKLLWTMQPLTAGKQVGQWDRANELGQQVAAGHYEYHVVVNPSTYENIGTVGNGGPTPDVLGHMPDCLEGVAVDETGAIYTANNWDEAGSDFKKWDADGKPIYHADYQIRNGHPNGVPHALAVDQEYLYCTMGGWEDDHNKAEQQVQRFRRSDGQAVKFTKTGREDGHINVYEWPKKHIPPGTPAADAALMGLPLQAIAVAGHELVVADALGGRILRFDKETGEATGEFATPLPHALAVDGQGRLWVGQQHHRVAVYSLDGKLLRDVLTDVGDLAGITLDSQGQFYVADKSAGQVKVYDVSVETAAPRLLKTLGSKSQPGDRAADHFFNLRGVAVDPAGNIITIQTEPICGARLARWSPQGKLLWEQCGLEFVSLANYNQRDPDVLYSNTFHKYQLTDHKTGRWEYVANVYPGDPKYYSDVHGAPRVLTLGQAEFVFLPTGDGVQVYRTGGKALKLVAMIGGREPAPDGTIRLAKRQFWTWSDTTGTGIPNPPDFLSYQPADIPALARKQGPPWSAEQWYSMMGMHVDAKGDIWFGNPATRSIWVLPIAQFNAGGNPVYDWTKVKEALPPDKSDLEFAPMVAQHAEDGSIYALGMSKRWPSPKNNPFWMGGTTVVRYGADGTLLWAQKLPNVAVGLDVIPGTPGCMAALGQSAKILHFSGDGLLIGAMAPGKPMSGQSGWMDNQASIAVNRDPRDGLVDVFGEDDLLLRVAWYRIDDRNIQRLTGALDIK